ncbi:hypothetical protein XELAEV_18027816mg [Xenopus laevis]|uniref:Uncharacterized protein n=1 Tax=Xenopus laevis TaxID=8355 RepID=A0A974HKC4_XENLA|nr:hypothetical protein XELAEV_18027816mg [Xenopus laevis]
MCRALTELVIFITEHISITILTLYRTQRRLAADRAGFLFFFKANAKGGEYIVRNPVLPLVHNLNLFSCQKGFKTIFCYCCNNRVLCLFFCFLASPQHHE